LTSVEGERWTTRAQAATLAEARALVEVRPPHAVLIVGPGSVGKTTLAEDLAAGLLCLARPDERPCRVCRSCRLMASGNHPDLHRLAPEGPGGQIVIGDSGRPAPRGVRNLVAELAYLPVEGGRRVALIEHAERMNEDAQNALLKTLEEPPLGVSLILCADEEDRLLPTVRSRCVRLPVAPLGIRAVEELLEDRAGVDAPVAARLARISAGRPGIALAYALHPAALTIRDEIVRTLLDLLVVPPSARLGATRDLVERALALDSALSPAVVVPVATARLPRASAAAARAAAAQAAASPTGPSDDGAEPGEEPTPGSKRAPAERRRAVMVILGLWQDLSVDLAVAGLGGRQQVSDLALLDDLAEAAASVSPAQVGEFMVRLDRIAELVEGNAGPELALDVLVLTWPRATSVAA
jgi:DNA polymerase III subunit delta'